METKICSRCKIGKPISEFYKDKRRKNGLHSECKQCDKIYSKQWISKNPEKRKNILKRYKINHPDKVKASAKKWQQSHPEYSKASVYRYRIKYPEKLSMANKKLKAKRKGALGSHTLNQWEELKKRYSYCCAICGRQEPFTDLWYPKLTEDHIIPISKGGSNYIENIQPLCIKCNNKKSNKI